MKKTSKKFSKGNPINNPAIYQRIYENSLPEVLVFYSDYRFISANPMACSLFGMTEEEIRSHFLTDLVDFNDPRLINLIEVAERTGRTHGEITLVRKNGSKFTCEINSFTFSDENGALIIDIVIRELINRRKEEEELSKDFALYQLAIDATNDGIWDMDMKTNRVFLSPNANNLLGFKEPKTLHRDEVCDQIIYKDDLPDIVNELNTVTNGTVNIIDVEFRVNTVAAGRKWIRLRGKVVLRDREGKIIRMLGTFADISNRKLIEKELERKQKEFQSYFDYGTVGQAIIGPDKSWIAINQKACQLLGYSKEELTGLTWIDLTHPEDVQESLVLFNQAVEGKIDHYNFEKRFIRKDGSIIFAHPYVVCSRNEDGSVNHFLGSFLDITEQKSFQQKITESETFYRTLVNISPNGVVVTDLIGKITFISKRAYQIIKIPEGEYQIGESIFKWVAPESLALANANFLAIVEGKRPPKSTEYKCLNNDRSKFWIEAASSLLLDASGNGIGVMTVIRDITDRKIIEEDLISAKNKAEENDKLKTAFLNNISHEIRTPLNAIVGFSSLLDDLNLSKDDQKSYVEIINVSSKHLLEIINDIFEISNIEAGIVSINVNDLDLNEMIEDLFNQFHLDSQRKNIQFKRSLGMMDEKVIVKSDKIKLVQVLSNLLSNSLKFTDSGIIEFGYRMDESNIHFYVTDTGKGIPENKLQKIFDRFYQEEHTLERLYEGVGLGLSISKAYVELLGGTLCVTSQMGKGSSFYFTIPFEPVKISNLIKQTISNDQKSVTNQMK